MSRTCFMKKQLQILGCLIVLAVLSGCSLAAGSGDGAQARDKLIGGLLTKDYIEQFKAVLPVQKVAKLMMEEKKIMRELTKCKKNKGKQCPK